MEVQGKKRGGRGREHYDYNRARVGQRRRELVVTYSGKDRKRRKTRI